MAIQNMMKVCFFFFFKRKALLVRGRQTLLSLAVHRETVPRTHIIQLHIMG